MFEQLYYWKTFIHIEIAFPQECKEERWGLMYMEPVEIYRSDPLSAIITSIPHGASQITTEMKAMMRPNTILSNNDWFLKELYSFLGSLNITTISANYSRYVIDVNRDVKNTLVRDEYTRSLVYEKSTFGKSIYHAPLSQDIISNRIEAIYLPYHNCLSEQITRSLKKYNKAFLFDLHSFYIQSKADIVLGTYEGKACSMELMEIVYNAFVSERFVVEIDARGLTGGYIVSKYSSIKNVEAIQIEMRYTTYIENRIFGEEEVITKNDNLFKETQERLIRVFKNISDNIEVKILDRKC
ncbi:N-formylglutamate amidohydrolase [Paenibacillus tarimensis]